jgi:diguanylate cyclase (GGDEF)-like protein
MPQTSRDAAHFPGGVPPRPPLQGEEKLTKLEHRLRRMHRSLISARAEILSIRSAEKSARHLAMHDGLTSLPNRLYFQQTLEQALLRSRSRGEVQALMYLDLDDFKQCNDRFGHPVGDALLRILAARLLYALRAEDMVGRMGGDEFACMVAGSPTWQQLDALAANLHRTVSGPAHVAGETLPLRISIGIAVAADEDLGADDLLRRADVAMYVAKRRQTGHEFYIPAP